MATKKEAVPDELDEHFKVLKKAEADFLANHKAKALEKARIENEKRKFISDFWEWVDKDVTPVMKDIAVRAEYYSFRVKFNPRVGKRACYFTFQIAKGKVEMEIMFSVGQSKDAFQLNVHFASGDDYNPIYNEDISPHIGREELRKRIIISISKWVERLNAVKP
jgi:hypothetical protein